MKALCVAVVLVCAGAVGAQQERFELENGVRAVLVPLPGSGVVAAQAIYPVGFMHDPEGYAQATHLAEHMVCYGATESFSEREAMEMLSELGMANAETLGSMTHYDYMVPSGRLGDVLKIERERLTSLRIDEELLRREAGRCDSEVEFVMTRPFLPSKWALAAANQWWRYGRQDARIMGRLSEMPAEELEMLIEARYRPEDLLLVVMGDFDPAAARGEIEEALGDIESRAPRRDVELDWERIEREAVVKWDLPKTVMLVAYGAPEDSDERLALSALSATTYGVVRGPSPVSPMTSGRLSPVGDAPVLFMVQLGGDDPMGEARALAERVETLMPTLTQAQGTNALRQMGSIRMPDLEQTIPAVMEMRSVDRERAAMMVIGQITLDLGIAEMLMDTAAFERLQEKDDAWWQDVAARHVNEAQRRILVLEPAG